MDAEFVYLSDKPESEVGDVVESKQHDSGITCDSDSGWETESDSDSESSVIGLGPGLENEADEIIGDIIKDREWLLFIPVTIVAFAIVNFMDYFVYWK